MTPMSNRSSQPETRGKRNAALSLTSIVTLLIVTASALAGDPGRVVAAPTEPAFPLLPSFVRPADIQHAPDGTDRLFVVEQIGRVWVFENDPSTASRMLFLDIAGQVLSDTRFGLLGLAFHPDYSSNGWFFVHYTAPSPNRSVISRFSVSGSDPGAAEPGSEVVLLEVNQPHNFHNGGQLAFGPDGFLYISLGDGGPYDGTPDPDGNGQNRATLLGSMLRIDVDTPSPPFPYSIPPGNPFAGNTEGWREEIWAWGLRNTWRFSFDSATGVCWGGENGENLWEEINHIEGGQNYGWKIMEGSTCFGGGACDPTGLTLPFYEYDGLIDPRRSVIGGYVYRGAANPEFQGMYIFGDFIRETIWSLDFEGGSAPVVTEIADGGFLSTFGLDAQNELLWANWVTGQLHRFVPTVSSAPHEPSESPSSAVRIVTGAFPNPFTDATKLHYELATEGYVSAAVYDARGARVRDLGSGWRASGKHRLIWDGRDALGRAAVSGRYFCRIALGDDVAGQVFLRLE